MRSDWSKIDGVIYRWTDWKRYPDHGPSYIKQATDLQTTILENSKQCTCPASLSFKKRWFLHLLVGFPIFCCHSFKSYQRNVKSLRKTTTMWISERFEKKVIRFVPTNNKTDSSSILELVFCQNWIWMNGIVTKRSDHVLVQNRQLQVVNHLIAACGKWMKSSFTVADRSVSQNKITVREIDWTKHSCAQFDVQSSASVLITPWTNSLIVCLIFKSWMCVDFFCTQCT